MPRMFLKVQAFFALICFVIIAAWFHIGDAHPLRAAITSTTTTSVATTTAAGYPVVKVVDGDTIKINEAGNTITLRLIGIDTPEVVDPRKPVECFGKAASDEAHRVLDGQRVQLEFDPSQGTFDKYGRTLAYVFLPDGTFFNEHMIAAGFAHEYTYRYPYKYQTAFKAAEADARTHQRGLWSPATCDGNTGVSSAHATSTVY